MQEVPSDPDAAARARPGLPEGRPLRRGAHAARGGDARRTPAGPAGRAAARAAQGAARSRPHALPPHPRGPARPRRRARAPPCCSTPGRGRGRRRRARRAPPADRRLPGHRPRHGDAHRRAATTRARSARSCWRHAAGRRRAHDAQGRLLPRARRSAPRRLLAARRPPLRGAPASSWTRRSERGRCSTACAAGSPARARSSTRRSRTSSAAAGPSTPPTLDAVEEALLAADMGLPAVDEAMEVLRRAAARSPPAASPPCARRCARRSDARSSGRPAPAPFSARPWVVFMVGVNGAGKTTTIGKLAAAWTRRGPLGARCARPTRSAPPPPSSSRSGPQRGGRAFHRGRRGRRPLGRCSPTPCARRAPAAPTRCSWTPRAGSTRRRT